MDIDKEIGLLQPDKVKIEISGFETQKSQVEKQLSEVKVVEPSEYYHEDKHDEVKDEYNTAFKKKVEVETNISSIEKLKSSVSGGIKCEHCGIELMNAAITQSRISELDGYLTHKKEIEDLMQDLSDKEKGFVNLKKEFDEYEKNKLIKEKLELNIESFNMKIEKLNEKLTKYEQAQEKIQANNKIDELLIKADIRLGELEREKTDINKKMTGYQFEIDSLNEKIDKNKKLIEKIKEESSKERVYKVYLETFGKNGISKLIMKTMMPLINSELQRLLEDSCHFRLEIRINDKNEVEFLMIDNNTQIEKLMSSGSGYERTIASLALRAVLSKICSLPKPNIIVFDEVFGKISNENLDMVSEFFKKIKEYFEKIFVITHNPLVTNWSDNVVRIEKVDNISFVNQ
jgi:DNA repair exonuclease SbcCD ATPase subunit